MNLLLVKVKVGKVLVLEDLQGTGVDEEQQETAILLSLLQVTEKSLAAAAETMWED